MRVDVASLIPDLENRLRTVEPGVMLLPAKLVRRIIRRDRHWHWLTFRIPHQGNYTLSKARLAELLLALDESMPAGEWPEHVILLSNKVPEPPAALSVEGKRQFVLAHFWRQLFHAHMHRGLRPSSLVQQRREALGETVWEEIRLTLKQERLLLPPTTDASLSEEFTVYFWELKFFAPHLLPLAFPSMKDTAAVEAMLASEGDAAKILADSRPEGIANPLDWREELQLQLITQATQAQVTKNVLDAQSVESRSQQADQARAQGNTLRAARLRRSAMQAADVRQSEEAGRGLAEDVLLLAQRFIAALELPAEAISTWQQALMPLVRPAAEGFRPETRALYEVQIICMDYERGVFTVDLVEHVRSFFRRPVKRPLPWAEALSRVRRLRQMLHLLPQTRLTPEQRHTLEGLLDAALHHQEKVQREKLRPVLTDPFDAVGLIPENAAERVARRKVIEELIDRLLAHGHLSLGEVRDALSRNQLKLSDLSGPGEFWRGDPLLQLDKRLALALDGVYRRGEFYLRWFQRISSLFFATPPGRFITRFAILPFVGAFVVLEGLQHIVGPLLKPLLGQELYLVSWFSVLLTGYILLGLIYVRSFRKEVGAGLKALGRGLRFTFVTLPYDAVQSPLVQGVWNFRAVQWFRERLFLPLVLALIAWGISVVLGGSPMVQVFAASGAFLAGVLFFSTRLGRQAREIGLEMAARSWHLVGTDFLLLLLRFIWDAFRWLVAQMDQALYAVDERLRFRGGENALSLGLKAVVGMLWFCIAYVVRFAINLLLEPQINPIKHFPVVTVSHKLLLPLAVPTPGGASPLGQLLIAGFGATTTTANTAAGIIVWGIPGIFGFLVWELKENWKLYRANRPSTLEPVIVGHHGETMLRLMKPGFHSGTLPKLYAKLRRAEAVADHSAKGMKLHHELHHAAEEIRRLVERDLLAPLEGSMVWQGKSLRVGEVKLGAKQIAFTLAAAMWPERQVEIVLREQRGWLIAHVREPAWLAFLNPAQAEAFTTALAGLYKLAGVDLVDEQLATLWPPETRYRAVPPGVEVHTSPSEKSALYPWTDEDAITPQPAVDHLPILPTPQLFFSRLPIAWQHWVVAWEREQQGKGADLPLQEVRLVPAANADQP